MTIWVNVTTAADWKQPPFGIVRVERNLAHALRTELGENRVRYCVWSRGRSAFVETAVASVREHSRQDRVSGEHRCVGVPHTLEHRAARRRIGVPLDDGIEAGPRSLGEHSWCLLYRARRRLRGVLERWVAQMRAIPGRLSSVAGEQAWGPLRPGDVLVTLGLEWETGCMPFLRTLKDRGGIRIIGCCHDLVPIKYPQYCIRSVAEQFPEYLVQLARACDAIVCVSECTLRDLRAHIEGLGLPVPRLFTIRLGADLPVGGGRPSAAVSNLTERPYVLFVSTIERRKNHEVLYRAFRRLAEIHGRETLPKLVFVGARGWGVSDLLDDIALDPITEGIIVQLHQVSDEDLCVLYQKALFCVFPSLYEGWGLPVAEALGFGTPVICSDRGPLPEVGGDLVEYLDPWDLPAWVRAIERLWLDGDHRRRLADRIAREYRLEDWSAAGAKIGRIASGLAGR